VGLQAMELLGDLAILSGLVVGLVLGALWVGTALGHKATLLPTLSAK
jgi:hypothetical protein